METAAVGRKRAKRFYRLPSPRAMQLTDRDLKLLAHVARHRFLTSVQLAALDGGSTQNVLRSLRALFDHQYLDRPLGQIAFMVVGGSQPFPHLRKLAAPA